MPVEGSDLSSPRKRMLNAGSGPGPARRVARMTSEQRWEEVRLDIDPEVKPDVLVRNRLTRADWRIWCGAPPWRGRICTLISAQCNRASRRNAGPALFSFGENGGMMNR